MSLDKMQKALETALGCEGAFDFKQKEMMLGDKRAICTYIIGYCDTALLEQILFHLLWVTPKNGETETAEHLQARIPFPSSEAASLEAAAEEVLRGSACLLVEGADRAIVLDVRSFSLRSPQEPEKDRTLRGPHTGTNESAISNLIQIRRYLRCKEFKAERFLLGSEVKNEVYLLYFDGKCDRGVLERIREKLKSFDAPNLCLTQETLASGLFGKKGLSVLNPFPRVRYTERPDVVAATLSEGKIALLCDNSPSVMLIPECIFDFFEETDDYYFPPVTASYLRLVRAFVFFASIFLIPIWLLLVRNAGRIPSNFSFILTEENYAVPLFLQFLIIELAIDGLRMASLNTPSTLSGSFSVIGGLLLGEFAVKSGWFVPQTILYSAFTGIANFIPTNYELGYSFKFMRLSLILLVEFFGGWGLLGGTLFWFASLFSMRSIVGRRYLYPLIPFDKKAFCKILIRTRRGKETKPNG